VEGLWRLAKFTEPRPSGSGPTIAKILAADEREIRRVQRESGRDLYWALYFLLTPGAASGAK
jgi:hypothetical protein